ncbi:MAG: parvulin peptidyl-prolyl isomerase [Ignavibacteriales bacterium]|nr:MAG: parvulin peptidyl-prolyl isomerase [Ignavibacteriales bacterium]
MKRLIIFAILISVTLHAQEVLDKIVAVVDNEIIMQSELDFQTNIMIAQQRVDPSNKNIKAQILNSLIEEKLLYAQAKLDSINVTDEEINRQIENRIDLFVQNYGSRERVEQMYGMSIEKIKREMRDDVKKYLMAEYLKQKKFGLIEATRSEVEKFYLTYKDSLGLIPEKYKIAHIFINPKASEKVKLRSKELALQLIDSIKSGKDFAELAKKYSEDPGSAVLGGDLGFTKRGKLVPEFEAAAFALEEGQISQPVETIFGFHIIQLLEKRGESIHARHILIKIKNDEDADLRAIELLNDIKDSLRTGKNTFEYYAKKYSDDKETAKLGGLLGTFELGQLDKSLLDAVGKLKSGEISYPKRIEIGQTIYGYHIVYLINKSPEHKANIDNDYNEIKQAAELHKQQKLYTDWIKELKQNIFWENRL